MLADVNTAQHTIPTVSNTETSELIYIATVILEALGYNIKLACRESSPWRRRLEATIKEEDGTMRDRSWMKRKYNKISTTVMANNTSAKWLVDLRSNHSTFHESERH